MLNLRLHTRRDSTKLATKHIVFSGKTHPLFIKFNSSSCCRLNCVINKVSTTFSIVRPRGMTCENTIHFANIEFFIGGRVIEIVDEWSHIGHIISSRCDDSADILNRRNCMIEQINNVICFFGKLDSTTKFQLVKAYCTSYYRCEK